MRDGWAKWEGAKERESLEVVGRGGIVWVRKWSIVWVRKSEDGDEIGGYVV